MSADAIVFEKTKYTGKQPVFFGSPEVLPGTFKLKQAFPNGTLVPKGTPIQLDFSLMEAGVVKLAKVVAGGTTTIPRVQKGHLLQVGDVVMKIGKTDLSVTVSSINASNASYDAVTLSGAVATLAAGDFLQECTPYVAAVVEPAADAVPAAALYVADAVISQDKTYDTNGANDVAASDVAKVLKGVAYPIPASFLNGHGLIANASVKYINQ